jgi:chorismate-pyruvate lyase
MPALDHLAGLFYSDLAELGSFDEVLAEQMPQPYRTLLAHHEHMTVAVERHYGEKVDVEVIAAKRSGDYYCRKIVLHLQSNENTVLFGIPRLNLRLVDDDVRREILSENKPLGRVLIDHNGYLACSSRTKPMAGRRSSIAMAIRRSSCWKLFRRRCRGSASHVLTGDSNTNRQT